MLPAASHIRDNNGNSGDRRRTACIEELAAYHYCHRVALLRHDHHYQDRTTSTVWIEQNQSFYSNIEVSSLPRAALVLKVLQASNKATTSTRQSVMPSGAATLSPVYRIQSLMRDVMLTAIPRHTIDPGIDLVDRPPSFIHAKPL